MRRNELEKKIKPQDASKLRVGVVVSRFNEDITLPMLEGALEALREWKVKKNNIRIMHVPGSFEIPFGALKLIKKKVHAVVTIGCIIKGETDHDKYIASAVSSGIMQLSLEYKIPISFGVITTNTLEEAQVRSSGTTNKGSEAAAAALEAALTK